MRRKLDFRNFDLRIETTAAGDYAISVSASPAGETNTPTRLPSPLQEIAPLAAFPGPGRPAEDSLQSLGQKLTGFLLPHGDVRDLYNQCLGKMAAEDFDVRFRLNVPPELAGLPWECAYDAPEGVPGGFFALNPRFSIVRYQNLLRQADSVISLTPVPILLVAASPSNLLPIAVEQEAANLLRALEPLLRAGRASVDILFSGSAAAEQEVTKAVAGYPNVALLLGAATVPALRAALRRGCRVLHLIGHGGVDRVAGGQVALADAQGLAAWVDEQTLAGYLREQMLAAAVLNVCHSAAGDTARAFMGLAPRLIQAGIPAVIAMQSNISDDGARRFSAELYRVLAEGHPLDRAVTEGRKALQREWAIPVLFMRVQDGLLWKVDRQRVAVIEQMDALIQQAQTAADSAAVSLAREDARLARGVARYAEGLRDLASRSTDERPAQPYKGLAEYRLGDASIFFGRDRANAALLDRLGRGPLTILHAESGAGKTSLLQAGIMPRLIADGHLPVRLRPYNLNPAVALKRALLPDLDDAPHLEGMDLRAFLLKATVLLGPKARLYVLLDQFEEFFAELGKPERAAFVAELAECLQDPLLSVRWLVALRSEAYSNLASFEDGGIRNPFENNYRLDRLTRAEAEEAISRPAAHFGVSFEPALMDLLLDDLDKEGVAPPQVQLVCQALYDERPAGGSVITGALYEGLGGARGILQDYLERVLRRDLPLEQRRAGHFLLESLISSEARRVARTREELVADLSVHKIAPETVDAVLDRLAESRLLRRRERGAAGEEAAYELAHDYLVGQIELSPEVRGRKAAQELLARELLSFQLYGTRLHPRALAVIGVHADTLPLDRAAAELLVRSAFETGFELEPWLGRLTALGLADLARQTLLDGLQADDPELRLRAAQHLGAYGDPEVLAALAERFTEDGAAEVRAAALAACAPAQARALALDGLAQGAAERRAEAASYLRAFLDPEVAAALYRAVVGDVDERAWRAALLVLSSQAAQPFRDAWRPLRRAPAARQAAVYELLAEWRAPRALTFHLRSLPALAQQYFKAKWRENWPAFIGAGLAALGILYLALALWRGWPPFPAKWERVPETPAVDFSALAVIDGRTYAGTFDYGLARRAPDGRWVFGLRDGLPTGPPARPSDPASNVNAIYDLAVAPGAPDRVFALVADAGPYVSEDAGAHWAAIGAGETPTDTQYAAIAAFDRYVLAAFEEQGLYGSADLGQSWLRLSGQGGLPDSGFRAVGFAANGDVYIGGADGAYRGAGAFPFSWEKLPGVPSVFYLDPGIGGRLFLGLGVERATLAACYTPDRGLWVARANTTEAITAVRADPAAPDALWVATTSGVRSLSCYTDEMFAPLGAQRIHDLVPLPAGDGSFTWLQASQGGLYQPPR